MLNTQYAQTDSRWAKVLLGFNTDPLYDLANYGCLVTAVGNMLWWITGDAGYTPHMMNDWLKDNNGFVKDTGIMYWSELPQLGHFTAQGTVGTLGAVDDWLQPPANYAILEVRNRYGGTHFVFAPLVGQIIDSEDGKLKSNKTYVFVTAHLFTAIEETPVVAPTAETPLLEPAVAPEPVSQPESPEIPPLVAPTVPVDTITVPVPDFSDSVTVYNATLIAEQGGIVTDYANIKSPISFTANTRFDIVQEFTCTVGLRYRTANSVTNGDWYGVDPAVFHNKLSVFQTLNLVLSQAFSLGTKFLTVLNPFKKGK